MKPLLLVTVVTLIFCTAFARAADAAPAVEVDLRFSPGPNGLPPANDSDDTQTEPLNKDGFAVFTQATQLPNSDFYTGYWLVVNKSPEGAPWPFNVQIYYNEFRGP